MLQRNFVIYTLDKKYGKKLLEMATNQRKKGLHFYLFHQLEKIEEFIDQQEIEYLVLGEEIPIKSRVQLKAKRRFLLSEEVTSVEEKSEQESVKKEDSGRALGDFSGQQEEIPVFKYQKGEDVLKEIYLEREIPEKVSLYRKGSVIGESLGEYLATEDLTGEALARENQAKKEIETKTKKAKRTRRRESLSDQMEKEDRQGKVIGIYSPIHRIGKTKFAIALGKEMAKQESVLYLNLEPFAGGSYFEEEEGDLSDLLYFGSQENQNLGLCISVMAGQLGKLDYIKPMPFAEDLYAVEGRRWKELITKILEQSIYQTILLDIGDGIKDLYEVLEFCDTVYTLYIEEPIAKGKLKQYTNNLIKTGYDSVLEHTVQKKVELK